MSANIQRAYKQFLKQEQRRKAMSNNKAVASTGLLSPRKSNAKPDRESDQIDTLISFVDEIRKYGGSSNG
jgi:hypothetical protein